MPETRILPMSNAQCLTVRQKFLVKNNLAWLCCSLIAAIVLFYRVCPENKAEKTLNWSVSPPVC
uniref:Uncharacterized protein n=1 Tax=Arundo donax TaxID=35708 RepID=A0A0A9BNF6_ARUDO